MSDKGTEAFEAAPDEVGPDEIDPRSTPDSGAATPDDHHRRIQGGTARAAVFGVTDGLVSNAALILGVAGGHPGGGVVRLAGLVGLVAGSVSMATGEYISMTAQSELLERELEMERIELSRRPDSERAELVAIYRSRGVRRETAQELAAEMMRDPELALETHAREELGIDPSQLGSPVAAAVSSFISFAVGAVVPLLPWFIGSGSGAILWSVLLGAVASVIVGASLSHFTGRSPWRSALRQLFVSAIAGGFTYSLGAVVGVGLA